tara:strand:+ start:487 stop:702 length:216 start_codon:yes stop_codon:yes gene_type:complete
MGQYQKRFQETNHHCYSGSNSKEEGEVMGKIVSRKLATKDCWIFSKSVHVFTVRKNNEQKKKDKTKPKGKK